MNLERALTQKFGQIPPHFLTIPISNADQGNVPPSVNPSPISWFQIFARGATKGEYLPVGTVHGPLHPSKTFTHNVAGLAQYSWYTSEFYNSLNMFQTEGLLRDTLTQYSTGQPTGPTWSQTWPGYQPTVPLLITELGSSRLNVTAAQQAQVVLHQQAQVVENQLLTPNNNVMGYTIFEYNDEPNKNGDNQPNPYSEAFFGLQQYNTSQAHFRNGTLLYHLPTGVTRWAGGFMPNLEYPVYALHPVTTATGQTALSQLRGIFNQKP